MLVTLCQSDTEEIRNVASETLLSLGENFFMCLLFTPKGNRQKFHVYCFSNFPSWLPVCTRTKTHAHTQNEELINLHLTPAPVV